MFHICLKLFDFQENKKRPLLMSQLLISFRKKDCEYERVFSLTFNKSSLMTEFKFRLKRNKCLQKWMKRDFCMVSGRLSNFRRTRRVIMLNELKFKMFLTTSLIISFFLISLNLGFDSTHQQRHHHHHHYFTQQDTTCSFFGVCFALSNFELIYISYFQRSLPSIRFTFTHDSIYDTRYIFFSITSTSNKK
jgi:hypothetical protein